MTLKSDLIATREVLADKERWTKGAFGRDALGGPTSSLEADAVCYCFFGGVDVATQGHFGRALEVREAVAPILLELFPTRKHDTGTAFAPSWLMTQFNDHQDTKHADVLLVLDTAIERAPA
jgi:hypothetical protein